MATNRLCDWLPFFRSIQMLPALLPENNSVNLFTKTKKYIKILTKNNKLWEKKLCQGFQNI